MTLLWTSRDAEIATGGTSQTSWDALGVSIDTRTLKPGDLFVALRDVRDGHDFVSQALEKGAAAALVSYVPDGCGPDAPLLIVEDVLTALEDLARAARERMSGQVIAVTGSVGKTSTKEMLRSALQSQGKTHAAERSYNNHWGVPLTLARMPADTEFALIEIGMNAPGEIGPLSSLARPHVALVTSVEEVHIAAFKSVRYIAKEKAAIFEGLEPNGIAVINRDIPTYAIISRAAKRARATQYRYGYAGRPEFAIRLVRATADGTTMTYRKASKKYHLRLNAPGKHVAQNALGVLAVVDAVRADIAKASIALSSWSPPKGRGDHYVIELGEPDVDGSILLIDESYNANPTSMQAALEGLALSRPKDGLGRIPKGRRIAVIGDMLELGEDALARHEKLAKLAAVSELDLVHTVGPLMKAAADALPQSKRGRHFADKSELSNQITHLLDAGDVVMVKASLGTGLGIAVDAIKSMGQIRATKTET